MSRDIKLHTVQDKLEEGLVRLKGGGYVHISDVTLEGHDEGVYPISAEPGMKVSEVRSARLHTNTLGGRGGKITPIVAALGAGLGERMISALYGSGLPTNIASIASDHPVLESMVKTGIDAVRYLV